MKEELYNESLNRQIFVNYISKLIRCEKEILELIVNVYTTQEIADKLFISFKIAEAHRFHLLQKLGTKNTAGLMRITMVNGLV
jgi:DNA-binding CsgD family transcriptional regulator